MAGMYAVRLAKKKNDPVAAKYAKFNKRRLELKKKLMKRYGRKGMRLARQRT